MKLVELLAQKLEKWADTTVCYVQDPDGCVWPCKETAYRDCGQWGGDHGLIDQSDKAKHFERLDECDDHETAIVTKDQWQAERDRQKGGEWKRHRGGKPPVSLNTTVEVKLRCGDIYEGKAHELLWHHSDCDVAANIMQYRVISQPQAEEVKLSRLEARMLFSEPCIVYPESAEAKTDQIDGPLRWRDCVSELDAYIEEFTRERESLINRLALEGFALIPAVVSVMSEFSGVDMSDWRNWRAGDIVECITSEYTGTYTEGKEYKVEWVNEGGFSVYDNHGGTSSCDWFDHDAEGLKFIRRP
jgi:hypothetical protein